MTLAPTFQLSNGVSIPSLGLGTWPMNDVEAETAVAAAIQAGYHLIDTAENYRNEVGVGRGIRASGIERDKLFVTTKFNGNWHGFREAQEAFAHSAQRLGLEYIDLLLIHWPMPWQNRYVEAWQGLIQLLEEGKVRSIGVSNFKPAHIDRLLEATGVAPHVNQIQLNPRFPRATERAYHASHGILTESWSPIGQGNDLLSEPVVVELAQLHGKTPAQVVLRWHFQLGLVAIPKSSNPQRLVENIHIFDFVLSGDEMEHISSLDRHGEGIADSDQVGH